MNRKLVSIQIISKLEDIPNADRILKATVLGWSLVVKKGEFKVGDKCAFFEIDSILPNDQEWSEFMRPHKFRVKTCKLRGVLSQGLALPLSILPDGNYEIGDDVSEVLGVTKYEPPLDRASMGNTEGTFPPFIPKTDELRLQSFTELLGEIKNVPLYYTQKCDGTSSTFANLDGKFYACSRNLIRKSGDNIYYEMAKKYKLQETIPDGFAIQGEICGPGVMKNKLQLPSLDLFVFNVFDIRAGKYLEYQDFIDFCKKHNLKSVPVLGLINGSDFPTVDSWLELAKGLYLNTKNPQEGIVIRSLYFIHSKTINGRLSFKVINNDYLLKYGG